jgi:hypothetical protein
MPSVNRGQGKLNLRPRRGRMLWGGWDLKGKFRSGAYTLSETALPAFEGLSRR